MLAASFRIQSHGNDTPDMPHLWKQVRQETPNRALKHDHLHVICTMLVQNPIENRIIALSFHQLACLPY